MLYLCKSYRDAFKRLLAFIFICLFCYVSVLAQSVITGRVISHADKKPVANASIFLSNTTIGNETEGDGTFMLKNIRSGKFDIIVSVIGFETYSQTVILNNNKLTLPDIELVPKVNVLKEVTIRSKVDPNRATYLRWFSEQFLGMSELAQDCKIVNPEVLDLSYDNNTKILTASSYDFLEIENRALGYRLKYLVTSFSDNTQDVIKRDLHYGGSVLFEKMKGTPSQEKRWQKRRQEAYEGSEMHFLRTVSGNRIEEEGFRVMQWSISQNPARPADSVIEAKIKLFTKLKTENNKYKDSLAFWTKKSALPKKLQILMNYPLAREEIIKLTDQKKIYALGCDMDGLHITYNKDHHFPEKGQTRHLDDRTNKEVTLVNFSSPYAFFDENGSVLNFYSVSLTGAWAQNRVAELLPEDYEPPQDMNYEEHIPTANTINPQKVAFDQDYSLRNDQLKKEALADSASQQYAPEKIYIQFDKPYYAVDDTIWFKAWLMNGPTFFMHSKSGLLHIDIANDSNKVIKQYLLPVQDGVTWGNIVLSKSDFRPGNFVLWAYTNWMRNFSDDHFFYKRIQVTGAGESNWLVNASINNDKNAINAKLEFTDIGKRPVAGQSLVVKLMQGRKTWYKQDFQTDKGGFLNINFKSSAITNSLFLTAENGAGTKAIIPLNINSAGNIDLQFMPEGGYLLAGINAHIAFKAIGEDGKGVDLSGVIVDQNQQEVATFHSLHNGMGSFEMPVKAGDIYKAKIKLPDGSFKEYLLPPVKPSGTVLQIKNEQGKDSLEVIVAGSDDIIQTGGNFLLTGKARGVDFYSATISLNKNNRYIAIAKSLFPTGIAHFTLVSANGQPLNERLVYIDHQDNLHVDITPGATTYSPKDSIALSLSVTDNAGKLVAGNFSLAVTDDAFVKADTLNDDNILSRMLLTSDLKAYVEGAGYYFQQNTNATQALDNLLLTQGWIGYEPLKLPKPYKPETEYAVAGNVKNVFNKSVRNTHVLLFSKSPTIFMDTLTDEKGNFSFHQFPRIDTPLFILKAVNRSGNSFNVGINVNEPLPPVFNAPKMPLQMPWYVNSDTTLMNYLKNDVAYQQQNYLPDGKHRLKEVVIKAKKIVKGSQNLNGPGNADVILGEKDLEKADKKSLLHLLEENIKGFHESYGTSFAHNGGQNAVNLWYFIGLRPIVVLVDGIMLNLMYANYTFEDLKYYLQSHNAEDIKGMEIMKSDKYTLYYASRYYANMDDFAFIELTTRSGHGPITDNTPGMYLYKPLAISWPKQFYKPRYLVTDTVKHLPDLRSTIHWEPNIITDEYGKATVWFYAADKPATYTIITEGTDFNGNLGYKRQKIIINSKTLSTKSK
jgi:hypothetical protein